MLTFIELLLHIRLISRLNNCPAHPGPLGGEITISSTPGQPEAQEGPAPCQERAEQVSSEPLVTYEPVVGRPGMDMDTDMFPWPIASFPRR